MKINMCTDLFIQNFMSMAGVDLKYATEVYIIYIHIMHCLLSSSVVQYAPLRQPHLSGHPPVATVGYF